METNALKQTAKEVNVQVEAFEKFVRIFEQNGQTQEEYSANLLSEVKESCEAFGIRMDVNKTPVDYRSFFMNTLMVKYAKILEGKANKSNNDEDQQTLYQEIDESECTAEEKLKRKVLYWEDVSEHNLQQLQINYEWADQLFLNKITQELDQTCMLTEKILRSTLESSKIHRELFLASLLDHDRDSRLIEKLDEILWNQWQEFFMKFAGSFTVSRNKSFYERMIKTLCLEVSTTAEADFLESLRTESLPEICAKPAIADDSRNPISKPQFSSSQNLSYSCETNLEPSTMNNASAVISSSTETRRRPRKIAPFVSSVTRDAAFPLKSLPSIDSPSDSTFGTANSTPKGTAIIISRFFAQLFTFFKLCLPCLKRKTNTKKKLTDNE